MHFRNVRGAFMDKKYCYRILGLAPGATPAQIKEAYENRIAKLGAPDYRDDPEYVRKKKEEAAEAYRALMGNNPSESGLQSKLRRLEKPTQQADAVIGEAKQVVAKSPRGVIIAFAVIIVMVIAGIVISVAPDFAHKWATVEDIDPTVQEIEAAEALVRQLDYYDYYDMLDTSVIGLNEAGVDWESGQGEYGDGETIDEMLNILYELDIYDRGEFFDYITGIEDYYYDYDDASCAEYLILWLGAPSFDTVAGSENLYEGEAILSYADYLRYLGRFIDEYK